MEIVYVYIEAMALALATFHWPQMQTQPLRRGNKTGERNFVSVYVFDQTFKAIHVLGISQPPCFLANLVQALRQGSIFGIGECWHRDSLFCNEVSW